MMNLGNISDQLPNYPNNIQGELRLILQTKDVFLVCYKHLEEYRRLVNEQNRLITKEFVQEQLQIGEDEIAELKIELQDADARLSARLKHNELLADHLASLGLASLDSGGSMRHLSLCRSPQMRKSMLAQRQVSGGLNNTRFSETRPPTHMIDNIALAIAEIHSEVRTKVKPLLEYYRDLFYLQLHFSLVLGQVCNYCMPLVTENIGLIDRIFFWSERPEFDLVRRAGDIGDRLKEIYTRAQTVLSVLAESVRFLQSKVELQKTLEQRFHERLDEQQKTKDRILREVHGTKQSMDTLEEENDRLVGSLVKVDPSFVDSRHFYELADGGNANGCKKTDTGKHNAEDRQDLGSSLVSGAARVLGNEPVDVHGCTHKIPRQNTDTSSPSCIENASDEMNNNKAMSTATDITAQVVKTKTTGKKKSKQNIDQIINDLKFKLMENATENKEISRQKKNRKIAETLEKTNSSLEMSNHMDTERENCTTPTSRDRHRSRERHGSLSKSRPREISASRIKQSTEKEPKQKSTRRANSADKQYKEKQKNVRSKSSVGLRRYREADNERGKRKRHGYTPEQSHVANRPSSTNTDSTEYENKPAVVVPTLKSKLLGRTKGLLEAALYRNPKGSITGLLDSSKDAIQNETFDMNNDAVTSASSLASLVVPESPSKELILEPPGGFIQTKQLRTLGPRKKERQSIDRERNIHSKNRSKRKEKPPAADLEGQLPNLSSQRLLTETASDFAFGNNYAVPKRNISKTKRSKPNRKTNEPENHIGDFLSGTSLDPLPSSMSNWTALSSMT